MHTVNVHEAKTNLSKILVQIEKGETYLICRNGKPIADIIPHRQKQKRSIPHPLMSKIEINYDPTEDLTEDEWGEIE